MSLLRKYDLRVFIGLAVVVTLVSGILVGMAQQIWYDEAYSIVLAQREVPELIALTAVDVHPPFYYLLLRGWGEVFGWGEMTLRVMSVVFYAAAVGLMVFGLAKMFGKKVAIMAMPIMASAPFLLRYGFEIRMYSLAVLIAVGSMLVLYQAWKSRKWQWWAGYAVLVALGMYTLYGLFLVFFGQLVWLTVMSVREKKKRRKALVCQWMAAYLGSIVMFMPWIPTVLRQQEINGLAALGNLGVRELAEVFSFGLLYTPLQGVINIVLLVIGVGIILGLGWIAMRRKLVKEHSEFLLVASCFVVPMSVLLIIGSPLLDWQIYSERYLATFIVFGYAAIAVMLAKFIEVNRRVGLVMHGAMVVILIAGVGNLGNWGNYNFTRNERPMARVVAAEMSEFCGDRIIVDDPYYFIELWPYVDAECNYYFWFEWGEDYFVGGYALLNSQGRQVLGVEELAGESRVVVVTSQEEQKFDLLPEFGRAEIIEVGHLRLFIYMR